MQESDFKPHLLEYRHDHNVWMIEIMATSPEDAIARARAIGFARYRGEVAYKFRIPSASLMRRSFQRFREICAGRPPKSPPPE